MGKALKWVAYVLAVALMTVLPMTMFLDTWPLRAETYVD